MTVVALTGGPCAGKSTALARLGEQLSSMGYHVYMVPEAATILLQGGARIHPDRERFLSFEKTLIETQMALEDRFKDLAQALPEKSIIICDRGVMDNKAYVNEDLWEALMDENGWSAVQLRDRRARLNSLAGFESSWKILEEFGLLLAFEFLSHLV